MPDQPAPPTAAPAWRLGDRVAIRHTTGITGRIVGLLGRLGPRGEEVHRVRWRGKPRPAYIEVLGEQMELLPPAS